MKYLLALISEEGGMEDASPEEMKAVMDAWSAYSQNAVDNGAFLAGEGLQPSSTASTVRITEGNEATVTDGPRSSSVASICSSARTSTRRSSTRRRSRTRTAGSRSGP
jgi:hypothetical protein